MREGMPSHNPEQAEQKRGRTLQEVMQSVIERIRDMVGSYVGAPDEELDELMRKNKDSADLNERAAELFRSFVPHAIRKPDKEYAPSSPSRSRDKYFDQTLRVLRDEKPRRLSRRKRMQQAAGGVPEIGAMRIEDKKLGGENWLQQATYTFQKDGGGGIIEEHVDNVTNNLRNAADSFLMYYDRLSGKKFDITRLAPSGVRFSPMQLKDYFTRDLHSYMGSVNDDEMFFQSSGSRADPNIYYGNIARKGGMLRLLHEIAHSWQQKYYGGEESSRHKFDEFVADARNAALRYESLRRDLERREDAGQRELFIIDKNKLENLGIQPPDPNMDFGNPQVFLSGDKFNTVLGNYESEERDAWAHAIRMVRFLKREGVNLEPELVSLEDFDSVVEEGLKGYQVQVDRQVDTSERRPRMVSHPRIHPRTDVKAKPVSDWEP